MKKNRALKLTLIILIIILLSIISFLGIYVKNKNTVENILPDYTLGYNLNDYRMVELKVSDGKSTSEDESDGEKISFVDTAITEVNSEEMLTLENYKIAKKVVEERLKEMQITDYVIKQNKENGTIVIELPNNKYTEYETTQLASKGEFVIVDSDTQEILMTNNDIKEVHAGYGRTSSGAVTVYVNFQFNKEGTQKFKNITNTYVATTENKETETQQTETQQTETQQTESEKTDTKTVAESENAATATSKQITIKVDGSEILKTNFKNEVSDGVLQLTYGSNITTTSELQNYLQIATGLAAKVNSGIMPLIYETNKNEVITSRVDSNEIKTILIISVAVLAIALLFIIVKYKSKGILASISLIGYIAILLLAFRYFNVTISKDGILAILFVIAVSYGIILSILKHNEVLKTVGKCTLALIPTLIIAISLTFANVTIGAVLFWGVCIALLYHISISNLMLED